MGHPAQVGHPAEVGHPAQVGHRAQVGHLAQGRILVRAILRIFATSILADRPTYENRNSARLLTWELGRTRVRALVGQLLRVGYLAGVYDDLIRTLGVEQVSCSEFYTQVS